MSESVVWVKFNMNTETYVSNLLMEGLGQPFAISSQTNGTTYILAYKNSVARIFKVRIYDI